MKNFKAFLPAIFFILTNIVTPQINFDKSFDGGKSNQALSLELVNDGNYVFAGTINLNNKYDALISKVDTSGNIIWSKVYDANGTREHFRKIRQTSDNGFILTGSTNFSSGTIYGDLLVCKIDPAGSVTWARKFGQGYGDEGWDVIETSDSCYLVIGQTDKYTLYAPDICLIKISQEGEILWQKIFVTPEEDYAHSLIESSDGGYIVSGSSQLYPDSSRCILLFKLSKDGQILWQKIYEPGNADWVSFQVNEKTDGSLYITGYMCKELLTKTFLLKTNETGEVVWTKILEGLEGIQGMTLDFTNDNGFIIGGWVYGYADWYTKAFLSKLNSDAEHEWTKVYSGSDFACIKKLPDNGYIAAGSIQRPVGVDLYIAKTDNNGYTCCSTTDVSISVSSYNLESSESHLNLFAPVVSQAIEVLVDAVPLSSINSCDETVPVELSSFNYSIDKKFVKLFWSTSSEKNNFGFEVYRNDVLAGFVGGYGTTTEYHNYEFEDNPPNNGKIIYQLKQKDYDGAARIVGKIEADFFNSPLKFNLEQNYPNPFNPATVISYSIPENNFVTLKVFDVLGNEILTLVNQNQDAGTYHVNFNGSSLASGIYYYSLITDKSIIRKKMLLLK